ncbi:serine hydrolase [Anaerococcus rubeinfantis]|uniref:serine hydrolase n=1 Tax=Anaerococcus rubeinfantis TaxID=1720199 RepID=UPI00073F3B45|nr:serine hydrolase [Anaerococcus rubeinfantis]
MNKNRKILSSFTFILIIFIFTSIFNFSKADESKKNMSRKLSGKNSVIGFKSDRYLNEIEMIYDSNNFKVQEKDSKLDNIKNENSSKEDDYLYKEINKIISEETENLDGNWQVAVDSIRGKSNISIERKSSPKNINQSSASTIKIFVGIETYRQVEEGILAEKDVDEDLYLMLRNSDNEATNRLIDLIGDNNMDKASKNVGRIIYKITGANRTGLYTRMNQRGKNNVASAKDLNKGLIAIYEGKIVNEEHSKKMIKAMANNTTTSKFKLLGKLPKGAKGLNKSGEYPDGGVENDAAIIDVGDSVFAISFLGEHPGPVSHKYGEQAIAMQNLGKRISEAYMNFDKDNE